MPHARIPGGRLFGNGTAQCDVREPGFLSRAPRSHSNPAGLIIPRGLLKKQNLDRQVGLFATESLILAQNERWRHGLGMQVERPGLPGSGERVRNAWGTCPRARDKRWKRRLIRDADPPGIRRRPKIHRPGRAPRPISWLAG